MSVKIVTPMQPIHALDGLGFNTFTTFANISPSGQLVIPQATFEVGLDIEVIAHGEYSTTGTPTLTLGVWINGGESNTATTPTAPTSILAQTPTFTTGSGVASVPWALMYFGRVRAIQPDNAATINGQGFGKFTTGLTVAMTDLPMPTTLAARTVTFDCSAARAIGVGAAWGTSSASNVVKTNYLSVRLITGY
jgi:hypothetical protein